MKVLIAIDDELIESLPVNSYKVIDEDYGLTEKCKTNISYFEELREYEQIQIKGYIKLLKKKGFKYFDIEITLGRSPENDKRTYTLTSMDFNDNGNYKVSDFFE
jgi:hypothetical protein